MLTRLKRSESREARFNKTSSNQHKEVKIKWLHHSEYIFISLLHVLTLSGRFRFGFGWDISTLSQSSLYMFYEVRFSTICLNPSDG